MPPQVPVQDYCVSNLEYLLPTAALNKLVYSIDENIGTELDAYFISSNRFFFNSKINETIIDLNNTLIASETKILFPKNDVALNFVDESGIRYTVLCDCSLEFESNPVIEEGGNIIGKMAGCPLKVIGSDADYDLPIALTKYLSFSLNLQIPGPDIFEPDNSIEEVLVLPGIAPDEQRAFTMTPSDNRDWLKISVPITGAYEAVLDGLTLGLNLSLELYDQNSNLIVTADLFGSNSGESLNSAQIGEWLAGDYYLKITSKDGTFGNYKVTFYAY